MEKNAKMIQIIEFENKYASDFKNIHIQWFESDFFKQHFSADAYDYKVIGNPQKYIIEKGGHIFLAKYGEKIVGTVALIKREADSFELSKLMILRAYRGMYISDVLMQEILDYCKIKGFESLWLESIRILKPALSLFRKYGFIEVPLGSNKYYERADIKMILDMKE